MKVIIYSSDLNRNIPEVGIHNYIVNLIRHGFTFYILLKNIYKVHIKITIRGHINYSPIWTL
jgi:hypothetical protein